MRASALIGIAAAAILAVSGASGSRLDAAGDVRTLVAEIERLHPNPYHSISRERFHAAADELTARAPGMTRAALVAETMRLVALLGEREGHSGIFPISGAHPQPLHVYPLLLYRFPEGYFVLRATDASLAGARIVAIEGMPMADVEARVRPLVSRDNESSRNDYLPLYVVSAEVLSGLGISASSSSTTFTVETSGGTRDVALSALTAAQYVRALGVSFQAPAPQGMPRKRLPLYLRLRHLAYGITPLQKGRAVYVAYNQTTYPGLVPRRLLRLARGPKVRRVIVDLRLNGGGDNTRYGALLAALRSRAVNRSGRLAVLIGRRTFSAAGNFAAEVDRSTRARFFGEATGGSPNNYGETTYVELPTVAARVFISTQWIEVVPGDQRLAVEPDVPVPITAADFFAGRDPVLAAALR